MASIIYDCCNLCNWKRTYNKCAEGGGEKIQTLINAVPVPLLLLKCGGCLWPTSTPIILFSTLSFSLTFTPLCLFHFLTDFTFHKITSSMADWGNNWRWWHTSYQLITWSKPEIQRKVFPAPGHLKGQMLSWAWCGVCPWNLVPSILCLVDNMKMILVSGLGNRGGQYHLGIGVSGVSDRADRPN